MREGCSRWSRVGSGRGAVPRRRARLWLHTTSPHDLHPAFKDVQPTNPFLCGVVFFYHLFFHPHSIHNPNNSNTSVFAALQRPRLWPDRWSVTKLGDQYTVVPSVADRAIVGLVPVTVC